MKVLIDIKESRKNILDNIENKCTCGVTRGSPAQDFTPGVEADKYSYSFFTLIQAKKASGWEFSSGVLINNLYILTTASTLKASKMYYYHSIYQYDNSYVKSRHYKLIKLAKHNYFVVLTIILFTGKV